MRESSPGASLLKAWSRLHRLPGGAWLFSRLLGWQVPYSGTIGARVLELSPGRVQVLLPDHRGVRNHLGSIHAIALVNVGELASGLALTSALPPGTRGIVTSLSAEYLKKARGRLVATCTTTLPAIEGPAEHVVRADIQDAQGNAVARVSVHWRLDRA